MNVLHNNALEVKGLSKTLGNFHLNSISFTLPKGYIMGYVGQNGAGKTTTIKLIMEQLKHRQGTIKVNGLACEDDEIIYKDSIGFVADESYFPSDFTIKDIELTMKDFYPSFDLEKFGDLVNLWNLPYKKKNKDLSKGMKIKLMFATVLARDTKILILDEATSGLDPVMRSEVLDILQEYIQAGERSVLFSTHIMSDLERIADQIFFLDNGQKVFEGYKDDILEEYVLVKGGLEDLSMDKEKEFTGLRKSALGFEGLLKTDKETIIYNDWVITRPSIEEIIVMTIQGLRGNRA